MKVSVITVAFNAASTLGDTLDSVAGQSHPDIEHLLIDGASQDDTASVVQRHGQHLARFISEPDQGIYDAMNKGIRLASGEIIGFLQSDDVLAHSEVIAGIADAFDDPDVDAVYGDLVYVQHDDTSRVVRRWKSGVWSAGAFKAGWMPPHPTFYARRSLYERLGGFDTGLRISADYDAMVRYLFVGRIRTTYIPEVLVRMRLGGASNRSLRAMLKKSSEDYAVIRQHGLGGLGTLLAKNFRKLPQFFAG
jgi:glycosyltransferase involved in cell wall biosynthesis